MKSKNHLFFLFLVFLSLSSAFLSKKTKHHKPCKTLVLYFHDIIYNGKNTANATSAIVTAPPGYNLTILAGNFHLGNIAVLDDPITLDNNLHSKPVGQAQGLHMYDTKNTFTAWLGFSFVLNTTEYKGSINFIGADPTLVEERDISVVGGTGVLHAQRDCYYHDRHFRRRSLFPASR